MNTSNTLRMVALQISMSVKKVIMNVHTSVTTPWAVITVAVDQGFI